MNLTKLFKVQATLNKNIVDKHNIAIDTVDLKVIAFKVEFGEFLNEHRFFKFWSTDQKANTEKEVMKWCLPCNATGELNGENCHYCDGKGEVLDYVENPLLEEYVDGIHFLLSIAIEKKWNRFVDLVSASDYEKRDLSTLALDIFNNPLNSAGNWIRCFSDYLYFGQLVGFTDEIIEVAYYAKNKINHERQENGY